MTNSNIQDKLHLPGLAKKAKCGMGKEENAPAQGQRPAVGFWALQLLIITDLPRKRKYTKREGGAGKAGQRGRKRRLTEGLALGPRP